MSAAIVDSHNSADNNIVTCIQICLQYTVVETANTFQFLEKITRDTGAVIIQVFKGRKDDFSGGLLTVSSPCPCPRLM